MKGAISSNAIPIFGVRKFARDLIEKVNSLQSECEQLRSQAERFGFLTVLELEAAKAALVDEIAMLRQQVQSEREEAASAIRAASDELSEIKSIIVETEDLALLQLAGVYAYKHPLSDAVSYQKKLAEIGNQIKSMIRAEGGAVQADNSWTVNGSAAQGRAMLRDFSKLMLRAFNAEADNLVRGLKPYKVQAAIERLQKVAAAIQKLGKTMSIRIAPEFLTLRIHELELTADFLQKEAEEKEAARLERERLREERKVQQEIERERVRLEKEKQHYSNALSVLISKGDEEGASRLKAQLDDVQRAIEDVDYRAANIRAGYVYVISNLGSFGENLVKVGMTRRLDPMDRIRELSDASVPFNFDVHALFFSKDAVSIEAAMHSRLADRRVNLVNQRREFFRATPLEAKAHLAELAGELLQFQDVPEALEYRESLNMST
jgi:hypothetical protein